MEARSRPRVRANNKTFVVVDADMCSARVATGNRRMLVRHHCELARRLTSPASAVGGAACLGIAPMIVCVCSCDRPRACHRCAPCSTGSPLSAVAAVLDDRPQWRRHHRRQHRTRPLHSADSSYPHPLVQHRSRCRSAATSRRTRLKRTSVENAASRRRRTQAQHQQQHPRRSLQSDHLAHRE
jgi:hypothetical protein